MKRVTFGNRKFHSRNLVFSNLIQIFFRSSTKNCNLYPSHVQLVNIWHTFYYTFLGLGILGVCFLRLKQVACFYFVMSLANDDITLCSECYL